MRGRDGRAEALRWSVVTAVAATASLAAPSIASAHSQLTDPPPRPTDAEFPGPCGVAAAGPRTVLAPGETIVVRWEQLVTHYGIFRIAFSPNDDAGFDDGVLGMVDDDPNQQQYELSVTLPACTCVDCTLQLFQGPEGGEGYYSCADIELRATADAPAPPCPMATTTGESGGSSDGGGSTGGEGTTADEPDEPASDVDQASSRCSVGPRGASTPSLLLPVLMLGLGRRRS